MSKIEEELQISPGKYYKILFSCLSASIATYSEKPLEKLNSKQLENYNHKIKEAVVSRDEAFTAKVKDLAKATSDLIYNKYIICDDNNKYLIVAFRGTIMDDPCDILTDVNLFSFAHSNSKIPGKFHSGFAKRSLEIPIDFFIDKLLNEDYTIVFTGHSMGASIAAIVAIRILFHDKVFKEEKLHKKVNKHFKINIVYLIKHKSYEIV